MSKPPGRAGLAFFIADLSTCDKNYDDSTTVTRRALEASCVDTEKNKSI